MAGTSGSARSKSSPSSASSARWFVPSADEQLSSRVSLHLGLRSADLYFRNLVVPGIGGLAFVRQLSWITGAPVLARDERQHGRRATDVARALEALACKTEYAVVGEHEGRPPARILQTGRILTECSSTPTWGGPRSLRNGNRCSRADLCLPPDHNDPCSYGSGKNTRSAVWGERGSDRRAGGRRRRPAHGCIPIPLSPRIATPFSPPFVIK